MHNKTPIILLHGSNSDRHQFILFKYFMEKENIGHVFTVNLFKQSKMDDYINLLDYLK